jgi:hypothetical protein
MIIKDDIIIAGKDAVGRLFLEPQYFRLQFARSGRGPTGKRIAEIVRSLFVQVMKEGERTVAMVFTEGPIAAPHDDVLLNPPPGKNVIPSTPKPGAQSADTPKALSAPSNSAPVVEGLARMDESAVGAPPAVTPTATQPAAAITQVTDHSCFTCTLVVAAPGI